MASLQQLLAEEGIARGKFSISRNPAKLKQSTQPDDSISLPIFICHHRKTVANNGSSVFSSERVGSDCSVLRRSNTKSSASNGTSRRDDPAIDEVAIRAVISILSGYVGRCLNDLSFRENLREKCKSCLVRRKKEPDTGIFVNMELGIESIEKLVEEDQGTTTLSRELRMKTLRNSIQLLSVVDSLNSENSKKRSTCGTPNSHISACAQLYLALVYKLEKNDRISARHLLQVFCDSPFLARTHLLPDLWEYFFLPHLLHLKIWYTKEVEGLSTTDYAKEKKMQALNKMYSEQMDKGTADFALYYKKLLKVSVKGPPVVPTVPLPAKPRIGSSRRRSSDSYSSLSSPKNNLYREVFGSSLERRSMDFVGQIGASINTWDLEEKEKLCTDEDNCIFVHKGDGRHRRRSRQSCGDSRTQLWPETQKTEYFRFLPCRTLPTESLVDSKQHTAKNGLIGKEENGHSNDLSRAIYIVCSSDILSECEIAIRVITKAWLDSHGDPVVEAALSEASIIEGMLEVLFASNDGEILEFVISILAEFVGKNEMIRQITLNYDPQLKNFIRLLRSSSLFLKAAVLLYLAKPKAKQMISFEWVPLVLRVLQFGDQLQTLFRVRCSPQTAAIYFLDQLLTGFDEDRNLENARQVVSLGGLNLLAQQIDSGDIHDRKNAALIMSCCIRADGSCRNYLAENLNMASLLELIVLESRKNCSSRAFVLLADLLCLNRRTQVIELLDRLNEGWSSLNTMHILLANLLRAPPEEYALVAAILLQLDLLGNTMECSVYREEAIEAMIAALDCQICSNKVQEQSARALLMLGGRFSFSGESSLERWLLRQAGFHETAGDSFQSQEFVIDGFFMQSNEEEKATENWQKKVATVLFNSGKKRLLAALSDSIANGIPSLARASIITVAWMASFLHVVGDENLHFMACSILMPRLLESLDYNKDLEERVLASYSLLCLFKSSEHVSMLSSGDKDLLSKLQNLSMVTWTANELVSILTSRWRHQYLPK